MAELHFGLQESCYGTDGPGDDGLVDPARLDSLDDAVLLDTADLAEEDKDLCFWVVLVAQHVVDEGGSGISVTANGDALVDTVGVCGDDVVELVGHAAGL